MAGTASTYFLFHDESGHANIVVQSEGPSKVTADAPPARPAGRVSWTFPTPRGQPAVSSGLGLHAGTAWIGLRKVREEKKTSRAVAKSEEKSKKTHGLLQ